MGRHLSWKHLDLFLEHECGVDWIKLHATPFGDVENGGIDPILRRAGSTNHKAGGALIRVISYNLRFLITSLCCGNKVPVFETR